VDVTRPEGSRIEHPPTNNRPQTVAELPAALSVAAHDVAEAIRVVSGYLELLDGHAAGTLDETAQRYVAGVRDGIEHLDGLVTGLLVYLRVNVEAPAFERVDLAEVLEEALRSLHGELDRRGARVEFGELPAVVADPSRMREALRGLVDNALTFTADEPPVIAVSAERRDDAWCIEVRDNGTGVPADARERVLEPFERAHPRAVATGPGLGLAIARCVIARRGGQLWVGEVEDGAGTSVQFTIPDEVPAS